MPAAKSLTTWLKPTASTKRKRTVDIGDNDKENVGSAPKAKRAQPTKATKSKAKPPDSSKEAQKLYADTLRLIDKKVDNLDRKIKKVMGGNSYAITTDTYAKAILQHLHAAKKLTSVQAARAFSLLLSMADASHCADMDATVKMSGVGDSEDVFKLLDTQLLSIIALRERPAAKASALSTVPHRWTREDADVGESKTGRPNKQQRNEMYRQKLDWEKKRRQARRKRRETVDDWITVALNDLKEERNYLDQYGVEGYFPGSIAKLAELDSNRV